MILSLAIFFTLLLRLSLLCEFMVHQVDGSFFSKNSSRPFGLCTCVSGHVLLRECVHSCDKFDKPTQECFWKCKNKRSDIPSKSIQECLCLNVPSGGRQRQCKQYQSHWNSRSLRLPGCCQIDKFKNISACIGPPEQIESLQKRVAMICRNDSEFVRPRIKLLCIILKSGFQEAKRSNGFTTEVLLRIKAYSDLDHQEISTHVYSSISKSKPDRTTNHGNLVNVEKACELCHKFNPTELRLPVWVTAAAGVGGILIGLVLAICISHCFLRPLAERELKHAAMRSMSDNGHSDVSNFHSMAPLMALSTIQSGDRQHSVSLDNLETGDRRPRVAYRDSTEFHPYATLNRAPTKASDKSRDKNATKPNIRQKEEDANNIDLLVVGQGHEYHVLEDMRLSNISQKPHEYLQLDDNSEQDGGPESRFNSSPQGLDYFVLETLKSE